MVEELLGWAAQVPPFATHLTGGCSSWYYGGACLVAAFLLFTATVMGVP
jgi:hypothetical protein